MLGFCYALVVTGHAHYLTVMAIHLMCQVMALPSQVCQVLIDFVRRTKGPVQLNVYYILVGIFIYFYSST